MILTDLEITTHQPFIRDICNQEVFHLCHLFIRNMGKYQTPGTGKMVIILEKEGVDLYMHKERDRAVQLINIVEYYTDFDYRAYEQKEIAEKKIVLWNLIFNSIKNAGNQLGWELAPIEKAYLAGIETNLKNYFTPFKSVASKDKQLFATILVHFDFYSFKVFVQISNENGVIVHEKKIIDRQPSWGWYSFWEYKFAKWNSADEFTFGIRNSKEELWTIKI